MSASKYVVKRMSSGEFWAGGHFWTSHVIGARWYDSHTEAELAALRALPGQKDAWSVELVSLSARGDADQDGAVTR